MGQIDFDNKNVSYAGEESLKQEVVSIPHSCMACKHCGYANVPYCRVNAEELYGSEINVTNECEDFEE